MFGGAGDQPKDYQRVQAQRTKGTITQLAIEAITQPIRYGQDVREKKQVEATFFQQPTEVLIIRRGQKIAAGFRMTPTAVAT